MQGEAALLRRAQEHDLEALGEIYDRYASAMYRYVSAQIDDRQMAEDIAGEVFLRMMEAVRKGSFARISLSAWLYRIARNLVVDYYRKRRPPTVPLESLRPPPLSPAEAPESRVLQEHVRQAIRQLTLDQRQVIVLRFGQKMKAQEVAQVLDKSEDAVRALQRRALASLRRILEEQE